MATEADGTAEDDAAMLMLRALVPDDTQRTVGADKNYGTKTLR
jgi:hypothetical protein